MNMSLFLRRFLNLFINWIIFRFTINKCLSPTRQLFVELNPQSLTPVPETEEEYNYVISAQVDSIEKIENILLIIHGSNGTIESILSKKTFQSIEDDHNGQIEIQHEDIGNVNSH